MLWWPAAAISSALLAAACPLISQRSGSAGGSPSSGTGSAKGERGRSPFRWARREARSGAAYISTPFTSEASGAFCGGRYNGSPLCRASRAAATAPFVLRSRPSMASSPRKMAGLPTGTAPDSAASPTAIGRSRSEPTLGRSAGARLRAIRPRRRIPFDRRAARTLSRASFTAVSGRPTTEMANRPPVISTSISMGTASIPFSVTPSTGRISTRASRP